MNQRNKYHYPEADLMKARVFDREYELWRHGKQTLREAIDHIATFNQSLDAAIARTHGEPVTGIMVDDEIGGDYCIKIASRDETLGFWMDQLIDAMHAATGRSTD